MFTWHIIHFASPTLNAIAFRAVRSTIAQPQQIQSPKDRYFLISRCHLSDRNEAGFALLLHPVAAPARWLPEEISLMGKNRWSVW
ncbi:MAG: hypothetical protein IGS48_19320 [Oscillatoriales cyanobacterium C42_A2020_001]|nr:hypothetical protein [Leptolyngbyaceae cyanobacterium C42_A2020_001]